MDIIWVLFVVIAIVSRISENKKKQAARQSRPSRPPVPGRAPESLQDLIGSLLEPEKRSTAPPSASPDGIPGMEPEDGDEIPDFPDLRQLLFGQDEQETPAETVEMQYSPEPEPVPEPEPLPVPVRRDLPSKQLEVEDLSPERGGNFPWRTSELAAAVVWKEILDGPRARRPMYSGRRYL